MGGNALAYASSPTYSTAIGYQALSSGGSYCTAVGANALASNSASFNTATGLSSLYLNTTGYENTGDGSDALVSNTAGYDNTATGTNSLYTNIVGINNTADGAYALFKATGSSNTAVGEGSMYAATSGGSNTALGYQSLYGSSTGIGNVAIGSQAGYLLTTGSNDIDLGNKGVAGESNTIRIGKKGTQTATYIAGISGSTVAAGVSVVIDTGGHLGTINSSARYKENIQPMGDASETLFSLQPVTFRYKHELDSEGIPQFGLVAEQVAKVDPKLVVRDDQGKPYSVRYEAVNAMLLNEFLKEHRKVNEQVRINAEEEVKKRQLESTIARQEHEIETLKADLEQEGRQIQKVNQQLSRDDHGQRLVLNEP